MLTTLRVSLPIQLAAILIALALLVPLSPSPVAATMAAETPLVGTSEGSTWGSGHLTLATPAGVRAGDVLVAAVGVTNRRTVSGPAGWQHVRTDNMARQHTQSLWTRVVEDGDTVAADWSVNDNRGMVGTIVALRGVELVDDISAATASRTGALDLTAPVADVDLHLVLASMQAHGRFAFPDHLLPVGAHGSAVSSAAGLGEASAEGVRVTRDASAGAVAHLLPLRDLGASHRHEEHELSPAPAPATPRWDDPAAWPHGKVPGAEDDVVVDGHLMIAGPAAARTVKVGPDAVLEFAPDSDATLEVSGNVVVEGVLRMRPASPDVAHILRFVGVDEAAYVGGGHLVTDSDVGLWFTGHGRADAEGSERLPWTRAVDSLRMGATSITLQTSPSGWQVGDEIAVTPTSAPGTAGFHDGYSYARVTAVSGTTVHLDTPLGFDHPMVDGRWTAEVMNLTRNVRVEGTPNGRAHVLFLHTHGAQHLRNVQLRHMGPRQETTETYLRGGQRVPITTGVTGRYPLHFHHNGAGSAGTMVENVVVRDSGHRAFVPHASDGITFRGTIAHEVWDEPYWHDRRTGCCGRHAVWQPGPVDLTYDRAIASLVRVDPPHRGTRLSGFELGHGRNLTIRDSVAVGIQGNKHAAGFSWPEGIFAESGSTEFADHWTFENNIAHNSKMNGIFVWQNTGDPRHVITNTDLYHNGYSGIVHGAYGNAYSYRSMRLFGNRVSGLELHAQGSSNFDDIVFDAGGVGQYGLNTGRHRFNRAGSIVRSATFRGYLDRAIGFTSPDVVQVVFVTPTFDGPESTWFHLADFVPIESDIRVELADGRTFRVHPAAAMVGTPVPAWNARIEWLH
jgi:hypothetical protein